MVQSVFTNWLDSDILILVERRKRFLNKEENIMKKIAAVLATVMVAGSLMVACGSEEAVVEMEETVVEETTVVEEVV